ncbi:hypothetical protein IWW39_001152 [Coemansia spiralis]|uniref:Uncharacterized protein n=1 Tax=Coemansia spiralis TaxID=417178 RepID=A0A9W8GQV5_9FUNG|nr:hypothetical protein IWW39_001152 [Coemansia spiralis]
MEHISDDEATAMVMMRAMYEQDSAAYSELQGDIDEQMDFFWRFVSDNNVSYEVAINFLAFYTARDDREKEERAAKSTEDIKRLARLWCHASKTGLCQEVAQQFTDEFARPLGNYSWEMKAQQQAGFEPISQPLANGLVDPETHARLYRSLGPYREGSIKIALKVVLLTEAQEVALSLRSKLKAVEAKATKSEDEVRMAEDLTQKIGRRSSPESYADQVASVPLPIPKQQPSRSQACIRPL